jgi:hypothetical protein
MAFGFDDFAKFFDPVSDALGTSGRKGVGLLQQKPEDLAMLAAIAAGGYGLMSAVPGAVGAGTAATLVTPEAAALAPEVLAATPEATGIMQGAQMDPALLESINGPGINTAYRGNSYLDLVGDKGPLEEIAAPYGRNKGVIDYLTGEAGSPNLMPSAMQTLGDTAVNIPTNPELETYLQDRSILNEPLADIGSQDAGIRGPLRTVDSSFSKEAIESLNPKNYSLGETTLPQNSFDVTSKLNITPSTEPAYELGSKNYLSEAAKKAARGPLLNGMDTAAEYFDKASKYAIDNPYRSAGLAYYGAYKTGMLDAPKQEPLANNYKNPYTMTGFQRSSPSPSAYRYTPRYAEGGIAGYARGGRSKVESAMDFYDAMNPKQEAPPLTHGDPGIYYDMDPDTRYLDPMEASMVRMSKLNSRTNVQAPTMAPSRRMGELNFKPVAAARGGIMGYASGGDVPIEDDEFRRLTGHGGGRTAAEPGAKFSPTSEGAAAVSQFGQRMKDYPGWAPLGLAAQVAGALASNYGDHMARNVNPNYSNEAMNTTAGKTFNVPTINADDDNSAVLGLDGGAGVSSSDFGGGAVDPAGRDADGSPLAKGGIAAVHAPYNLGSYAAGGNPRLLRGPGDGMSDNIPATINNRQPARLADGEFVIPADVVSHLGNGSTEAGAKQLHDMMTKIRRDRTGNPKQGKQINPQKYLPA